MKKSVLYQLTAIFLLALAIPSGARAQTLTLGAATPSASSTEAGGLRYSGRIGYTGCAKVSKLVIGNPSQDNQHQTPETGDISPNGISASAYPNPFADEIRITFPVKEQAGRPIIQIIDNAGRAANSEITQYSESGRRATATISAAGLPSGKYIIRILTGGCIYAVSAIKI